MTILFQDVIFVFNIIGAAIIFFVIYGFIIWLLGITIYEFCLAHAYFFKRCYKNIFGESPSNKATVAPFVPIDIILTGIDKSSQLSRQQTKPYVVESREIMLEV